MQNSSSRRTLNAKADCYIEHSFLQQEIAKRLDDRLSYMRFNPEMILDLGAATGFTTKLLKKRYPKSKVIACDEAESLLYKQNTSRSWLSFKKDKNKFLLCSNAEHLSLADNSVDLVFSNLMLPWHHSEEAIFLEIFRVLKPGAALLLTSFGPDTFKELKKMNQEVGAVSIPNFKDMHDIGDILLRTRFVDPVVDMEMLSVEYDNFDKLNNDLHHQNINLGLINDLQSKKTLSLTYEIIYGHAWMPENKVEKNPSEYFISLDNITKKNHSSS